MPRSSRSPTRPGLRCNSNTASVDYDIGAVTLAITASDGTAADGTAPIANGDTVAVDPTSPNELSADLEAVVGGQGTPPGPLDIDFTVGATDETATLFTQPSEEDAPSNDPGTGATDYFWTIPANALTSIGRRVGDGDRQLARVRRFRPTFRDLHAQLVALLSRSSWRQEVCGRNARTPHTPTRPLTSSCVWWLNPGWC